MIDAAFASIVQRVDAIVRGGPLFATDLAEIGNFALDRLEAAEPDQALQLLEPLRERAKHVPRLWHALAMAYRAEQRTAEALDAAARAAKLEPNEAHSANTHAVIAFEAGQQASTLFKVARALSPRDEELALSAAAALGAEGKAGAAESVLEKLIVERPEHHRAHNALATLRWMQGDCAGFDRSYAGAVQKHPQDLGLWLAWNREVEQVGQYDKSDAILAQARTVCGERMEFDAAEAHVASERGDDARAHHLFEVLAERGITGVELSLIRHRIKTGNIDGAEQVAVDLLGTGRASFVWPYLSLIWRLKGDPRAQWLDGEPPYFRVIDLDYSADELEALAGHLRRLHVSRFHPPEQSMRGGTQTEGNLLLRIDPEIRLLRERLVGAIRDYVDALPPHDPTHPLLGAPRNQLLFVGSWSVRLTQQGFHVCHTHQQGWISSAFYVSLPKLDQMGPAPAGWLELGAPPQDLRVDLPAYAKVEPKPGRLVLFPSTMWHGTVPFNDGERLTVAFDVARTIR